MIDKFNYLGPIALALAPAWFVYQSLVDSYAVPWLAAGIIAAGVEATGLSAFHTAIRLAGWNRSKRKTDPPAPLKVALAIIVIYVVVGTILTAYIKADWTLGLFFALAAAGYVTVALNADQDARERDVETAKATAKAERKAKKASTGRSVNAQPTTERSAEMDERLLNVHQQLGERSFKRLDVERTSGLAKTKSAELIKYGLDTGQIAAGPGYQYAFVNGKGD